MGRDPRQRSSGDDVELVGIPVLAYGFGLGDLVRVAASAEGVPVAVEVVRLSGNATFRAWFAQASHPGEHWRRLMLDLEPFGCWFDTYSERLIAISVDEARELSPWSTTFGAESRMGSSATSPVDDLVESPILA